MLSYINHEKKLKLINHIIRDIKLHSKGSTNLRSQ